MSAERDSLNAGKEVCAVAVTFHPDSGFRARCRCVLRQVARLVIVDNGSSEWEISMLQEIAAEPAVTLVRNFDNLGVAQALNSGISRAAALGFGWVLLLDQDSCIDDEMVQTLISVRAAFPDRGRLALIGSGFRPGDESPQDPNDTRNTGWQDAEAVITSGSLVSLAAYAAVGPFREEFFIDHVDTEYCWRARAAGFRVIRTRKPLMTHSIGSVTWHRVLWLEGRTYNYVAERRYYIARNGTVMLREQGRHALGSWAIKSLGLCARLCRPIALYEEHKLQKIAAIAQGWWHGIHGCMGPRPRRRSRSELGQRTP
jgi:rhamnosyltransferase